MPREEEAPPQTSRPSWKAVSRKREQEPEADAASGQPFTGATLARLDEIARELLARAPGSHAGPPNVPATSDRHDLAAARDRESRIDRPQTLAQTIAAASPRGEDGPRFETPTPTPDIHIVIGKITVQGSTPPVHAAVPPPTRPAPKMTLEQYLQARGAGR
jgi:hypothetical protein